MKRGELKKLVLDFVDTKGAAGATYTEIIAFIVKLNRGRDYDWRRDRGYYTVCMQDPHQAYYKGGYVTAGPLRKPTIQCKGYLVKINTAPYNKPKRTRYFTMNWK